MEMPVILVNEVEDEKRIIRKKGAEKEEKRHLAWGRFPPPPKKILPNLYKF
jgi:hypothetical protein